MADGMQKRFQEELAKYKQCEKDKQRAIQSRQQLEGQLTENKLVKQELDLAEPEANVFKLIGPVQVKQDLEEARRNVGKRIEYIEAEIKRQEATLEDIAKREEMQKETLTKLQQQLQQAQVKAAMKA